MTHHVIYYSCRNKLLYKQQNNDINVAYPNNNVQIKMMMTDKGTREKYIWPAVVDARERTRPFVVLSLK